MQGAQGPVRSLPMESRDRLLSRVATLDATADTVEVDVSGLVHRLVLFDQVVLQSIRLKEIPDLVRAFGADGLRRLLECEVLRVSCDGVSVANTGQAGILETRRQKGMLPLGSYSFDIVRIADRPQYLERCLREVDRAALPAQEVNVLKDSLLSGIIDPIHPVGVEEALIKDAVSNRSLFAASLHRAITARGNDAPALDDIRFEAQQLDAEDLRVETNLQALLRVDQTGEHKLVERALLGLGGLNLRIATMRLLEGVEALGDADLPLLDAKLGFLIKEVLPDNQLARFDRVLEIADLPEVDDNEDGAVDVERLLEVRAMPERQEFRAWLRETDGMQDDVLRDLLPGLRDRLAYAIRSKRGRATRFVVSTGTGLATGDVTGTGGGVIDSFLLERVLPRPGPLAWLALAYPSVLSGN
jgi:hypothetical protein